MLIKLKNKIVKKLKLELEQHVFILIELTCCGKANSLFLWGGYPFSDCWLAIV